MISKIRDQFAEECKSNEERKVRKLDKDQFGNCRICNAKASGIHYGVASCEGCKVIDIRFLFFYLIKFHEYKLCKRHLKRNKLYID